MEIHRYLFLINENNVKTYCYDGEYFETIKINGNDSYQLEDGDFWKWWEKVTSYLEEYAKVDFCFLINGNEEIADVNYPSVEKSNWTITEIKQLVNENYENIIIEIKEEDKSFEVDTRKKEASILQREKKCFYLKTIPEKKFFEHHQIKTEEIINEKRCDAKISPLTEHFRKRTEEINNKK